MNTATTATAPRQALKDAFPGVRFNVRAQRGSTYPHVAWTGGPTWQQVAAVIGNHFIDERTDEDD